MGSRESRLSAGGLLMSSIALSHPKWLLPGAITGLYPFGNLRQVTWVLGSR
jgi:hypothetical protein